MKVVLILVTLVAVVAAEFHSEWYVWRKVILVFLFFSGGMFSELS